MAKPRVELQSMLETLLGSRRVYFQPPVNTKLEYPCIRYSLTDISNEKANNKNYKSYRVYEALYITKDPDSALVEVLDNLDYCRLERVYKADNLYHYSYTIYF